MRVGNFGLDSTTHDRALAKHSTGTETAPRTRAISRLASRAYAAMAREDRLAWATLDDVADAARAFLDPVLAGEPLAPWDNADWRWK